MVFVKKKIAICDKYYGFIVKDSIFKVYRQIKQMWKRKQTFREPRPALTMATALAGSWADIHRILLNWCYVFHMQLKLGNWLERIVQKNTPDKHFELHSTLFNKYAVMVEYLFTQLRFFFTWTVKDGDKKTMVATILKLKLRFHKILKIGR